MNNIRHTKIQLSKTYESMGGEELEEDAASMLNQLQAKLNKDLDELAHNFAISFNRRGEIRDRTSEGQGYRIAGMNLMAAIIIYWNTKRLGEIVAQRIEDGNPPDPELLRHVSPLGWEQIILTGKYTWALA